MDFTDLPADAGMITPSSGASSPLLPRGEERLAAIAPCFSHREDTGSRKAPDEGGAYVVSAERGDDVMAREALLDRAMGPGRRRKSSEKLRRGRRPSEGLAFAAQDADGRLIGTVRLWDVALDTNTAAIVTQEPPPLTPPHKGEGVVSASEFPSPLWGGVRGGGATRHQKSHIPALLLGPLAVDPSLKGAGVGSALMRHAIAEAARLGHRAILLVGDAAYYRRFGFSSEKTGALSMPGPYERDRFLALELVEGTLDGASGVLKASGRKAKPALMARAA